MISASILCIFLKIYLSLSTSRNDSSEKYEAKVFALLLAEEELPYSYEIYYWSLKIAEERVNQLYSNLDIKVKIKRSPIRCDSSAAPVYAAEEYYKRGISALLGPSCTRGLEPVARMASYWNVPLCTPGGIDVKFRDKDVFTTLTRITFSLDQIGPVVSTVLRTFSWRHVAIIIDETEDLYLSLADCLSNYLQDNDRDFSSHTFPFSRGSKKKLQFTKLLRKTSRVARVVIIMAGGETVRNILLEAEKQNMGSGDYVFLAIDFIPNKDIFDDFSWFRPGDANNAKARKIFDSLLILSIRQPIGSRYEAFKNSVLKKAFNNSVVPDNIQFNLIVSGAYDCIVTYAWALNKTLNSGVRPEDGSALSRTIRNVSFTEAVIEQFIVNENGDRLADFTLRDFNPESTEMNIVAIYHGLYQSLVFTERTNIHWPGPGPPLDVPFCGFAGDAPQCKQSNGVYTIYIITGVICLVVVGITMAFAYLYYQRYRFESELSGSWWRVRWEEVVLEERLPRSFGTLRKSDEQIQMSCNNKRPQRRERESSRRRGSSRLLESSPGTNVGFYKGMRVAVKKLTLKKVNITTELLVEMRHMRDLNHENLIRFIGVCPEEQNVAILCEYSPRGCLKELLQNEELLIDWPFRFCIIADITEGMCFLHSSSIAFHGRLKSTSCVIDGRFVVKITDFGLHEIGLQISSEAGIIIGMDAKSLLWTAPEHLREEAVPRSLGSQKGDVYSFAIILQEIITRSAPYDILTKYSRKRTQLTHEEIVERVRVGTTPPYRPEVSRLEDCPSELLDLINQCWDECPQQRPSFSSIRSSFKRSNLGYDSDNLLENLLSRMEQYTNNLEQLAEQRTNAFLEEKQKSEELLYEVLPKSVADQLKSGNPVQPEDFDCVTICFSDIVGFTRLAAESTPMQVVSLLNDLYTCFDSTIADYDVYKVETIGDAYMVVSGCPLLNGTDHAREISRMSLALVKAIEKFQVKHRPDHKVKLRIGIHSGPCAVGVVGLKMPRYCLFGETVNIAIRMEGTGEAMKIHVSDDTKKLLDNYATFRLEKRGEVALKDFKIVKVTHWLLGEDEPNVLLPIFPPVFPPVDHTPDAEADHSIIRRASVLVP